MLGSVGMCWDVLGRYVIVLLLVNCQIVRSRSNPHGQDQYMQLIEMWIEATMFPECHVSFTILYNIPAMSISHPVQPALASVCTGPDGTSDSRF